MPGWKAIEHLADEDEARYLAKIARAKRSLADMELDRDLRCFGVPIHEFDKEDLITIAAMMLKRLDQEQELHRGTVDMLTACSRQKW